MRFDVIIVGASIAGSSLAYQLGNLGVSVALIDKAFFPREKACGEGLSAHGLSLLRELGLAKQIESLPKVKITGYRIETATGLIQVPHHTVQGIGISRPRLDHALLQANLGLPNVITFLSETVRSVSQHAAGIKAFTDQQSFSAKFLVLADGANSPLANALKIPFVREVDGRFGLRLRLKSSAAHKLSDVFVQVNSNSELYLTPVSAHEINLSFIGAKDNFKQITRNPALVSSWISKSEELCAVKLYQESDLIGAGPLGKIRRRPTQGRVLCIGDAAETFDPLGGMGMTHALLSSKLAAQTLRDALFAENSFEHSFKNYASSRWHHSASLRGFTRITAALYRASSHRKLVAIAQKTGLAERLVSAINYPLTKTGPLFHAGLFIAGML